MHTHTHSPLPNCDKLLNLLPAFRVVEAAMSALPQWTPPSSLLALSHTPATCAATHMALPPCTYMCHSATSCGFGEKLSRHHTSDGERAAAYMCDMMCLVICS
jgi:hypothetical protein